MVLVSARLSTSMEEGIARQVAPRSASGTPVMTPSRPVSGAQLPQPTVRAGRRNSAAALCKLTPWQLQAYFIAAALLPVSPTSSVRVRTIELAACDGCPVLVYLHLCVCVAHAQIQGTVNSVFSSLHPYFRGLHEGLAFPPPQILIVSLTEFV